MHDKCYASQCESLMTRCSTAVAPNGNKCTLFALALGSFCIGTSEFASMGILQLFAAEMNLSLSTATHAITSYALGVVIGAPLLTLIAARMNRRTLLLLLVCTFIIGNVLSFLAPNIAMLSIARFISGLPQGAYFGAGALVATAVVGPASAGKAFAIVMMGLTVAAIFGSPLATALGQHLGWRQTYLAVAILGVVSFIALWLWVPRTESLNGGPISHELVALGKPQVWVMMVVAALSISSIFAVYTFIGTFVTDVALLSPTVIPYALAVFGIGMTVGNLVGGTIADRSPWMGLVYGFGCALVVLVLLAIWGAREWVLMATLFGVGATTMCAIPTIQVRLTALAPTAPTLMGAMNLASLNLGNAIGAWSGGVAISMGYGLLSAVWAGFLMTSLGLIIYALAGTSTPKAPTSYAPT